MEIKKIKIPQIKDPRGNLSFVEGGVHIPFEIKRVYYLYDVPHGAERGGHAHRCLQQVIVALSGAFELIIDDGFKRTTLMLSDPTEGILIDRSVWRELKSFSSGALCMVFASDIFRESDYIRDYQEFVEFIKGSK